MTIIRKTLLVLLGLHLIGSGAAFSNTADENTSDKIRPYVALLFPTAESGFFDLVIVHVLGLQNFQALSLDEEVSHTKLLSATGNTLLQGAYVIPVINVLQEWEVAFMKMIKENTQVKREYLSSLASIASAVSTALTFHMHYDAQIAGVKSFKGKYIPLAQITALSGLETLGFHAAFSFGAAAIDKGLDTLHSTTSDAIDKVMKLVPGQKTFLLDLIVCHALAHKNYDAAGLDKKPSIVKVAKAFGTTLAEGGFLMFTILNGALKIEDYFNKAMDQALVIKRDYVDALVHLATDISLALAFHMHYENSFNSLSSDSMTKTYTKLASIVAKTTAEGAGFYVVFRLLGAGLDKSFDTINSYLG